MKYRKLGRTGLEISEISLGTWAFGNNVYGGVAEEDGINTIHAGIDIGVNIFDTAPQYGTAEQQTDYIDVLFFHSPFSPDEINDDVWEGIAQVKKQGKVRFVGHSISMFQQTEDMARQWAKENKIDVIQVVLSLMNRESQQLIEELQKYPIGVFARECLANGFLSGAITKDTIFAEGTLNARYSREELAERVNQVNAFKYLIRNDINNMPQAALRWVLDQKGIFTVLSGAKNIAELKGAVSASDANPFSEEELKLAKEFLTKDFEAA